MRITIPNALQLATLHEQADHIWYHENPDTVEWAEISWVERFWDGHPESRAYGYVSI